MSNISESQWSNAQTNLAEADLQRRQARQANRTQQRRGSSREATRPSETSSVVTAGLSDYIQRFTAQNQVARTAEADQLAAVDPELQRALTSLTWKNLSAGMKAWDRLQNGSSRTGSDGEPSIIGIRALESIRRTAMADQSLDSATKAGVLALIDADMSALGEKQKELLASTPEAFYGIHLKEVKEYSEALAAGARIVETPSITEEIDGLADTLATGRNVFIHGHLGSGKTELAVHLCRTRLQKEPIVISGSKEMKPRDVYGHDALDSSRKEINPADQEQYRQEVWKKYQDWLSGDGAKSNPTIQAAYHATLIDAYHRDHRDSTISRFILGPIYQAMSNGVPLILDEINAIPHELLIGINHLLTRRPGDKVTVQQNGMGEITVQPGFVVIATGNLNDSQVTVYVERQKMDPAFMDRFELHRHDYLPQATDGPVTDAYKPGNDLFTVLVAMCLDVETIEHPDGHKTYRSKGSVKAKETLFADIWALARAARESQESFSGTSTKAVGTATGGRASTENRLKQSVVSMRRLEAVIQEWKRGGFRQPLDQLVWKHIIEHSINASDKKILYGMFQIVGIFSTSTTFEAYSGARGKTSVPPTPDNQLKFFGPREVVEALYGPAPQRTVWPELNSIEESKKPSPELLAKIGEFEAFKAQTERQLEEINKLIEKICGPEQSTDANKAAPQT